jgi:hypothetical protein
LTLAASTVILLLMMTNTVAKLNALIAEHVNMAGTCQEYAHRAYVTGNLAEAELFASYVVHHEREAADYTSILVSGGHSPTYAPLA